LDTRLIDLFDHWQQRAKDDVKRRLIRIDDLEERSTCGLGIAKHFGREHLGELFAHLIVSRDRLGLLQ
jgi:hypothetical protein